MPDNTPFDLLETGNPSKIQKIPNLLNESNVNEFYKEQNKLNIFEVLCNLLPQQHDEGDKKILEIVIIQILEKMFYFSNVNWDKKDHVGNTIFEWAIWSGSSKIMEILHNNKEIMAKLVEIEKKQMNNFWRVMMEQHIPDDFRQNQIEKFTALGFKINEFIDNHTPLYNAINILLTSYIAKYIIVAKKQSNNLDVCQSQINTYTRFCEQNFIIYILRYF